MGQVKDKRRSADLKKISTADEPYPRVKYLRNRGTAKT